MRFRLFLMLAAGLAACEPTTDDAPTPAASPLDFSRYVAVGDDYTAGVYNGSLTRRSQEYAFPNLLAQQLKQAGGGEFVQPLLGDADVFGAGWQLQRLTDRNLPLLGPVASTFVAADTLNPGTACAEPRYQFARWSGAGAALPHNLGVPGLRLQDINTSGVGNVANRLGATYNPFLERLLPADDNRTYQELLKASRPTFFTVSMGMSDMLTYLRSGGTCGTPVTAPTLQNTMFALVDSLLKTGAKGLVFDLPDPSAALPLTKMTQIVLNKQLGRAESDSIYIVEGGTLLPLQGRDAVLLPLAGRVGRNETAAGQPATAPLGSRQNPLRDEDVLTEAELRPLGVAVRTLNTALATRYSKTKTGGRAAFVSLNSLCQAINSKGALIDGVRFSGDPVTGGFFSYDGVSLTPRGNALLTNKIIEVINSSDANTGFGAHVPGLDVNQFPAVPLP